MDDDLHAQTDAEFGPCDRHAAEPRAVQTYRPDERPDVLVQMDDDWYPGELRQWSQDPAGQWWAQVNWRPEPGHTYLADVPRDRVKPDGTTRIHDESSPVV